MLVSAAQRSREEPASVDIARKAFDAVLKLGNLLFLASTVAGMTSDLRVWHQPFEICQQQDLEVTHHWSPTQVASSSSTACCLGYGGVIKSICLICVVAFPFSLIGSGKHLPVRVYHFGTLRKRKWQRVLSFKYGLI